MGPVKPWTILAVVAGISGLLVTGTSLVAVWQFVEAREARARAEAAEQRAAELQDQVDDLEARVGAGGSGRGGLEDLLEDLLGGDGGLEDLEGLEDLFGGLEGMEDLFGGPSGDGARDTTGAACLADAAGGLLRPEDSASDLPPDELVEQATDQVADLRELAWTEDVDVALLDDEAMRDRLLAIFEEEYPVDEAEGREAALRALGAIPADADLRTMQRQLFEEQVAGFYDPDTGELVVGSDGDLSAADRVIVAHELGHALVDQAIGLPDIEDPAFEEDHDRLLSTLALVEGDATLLMHRWALETLSLEEQLAMASDPSVLASQQSLEGFPHHLAAELQFPYLAGMGFACDTWRQDGWAGVDGAYADPPSTTATVLWPDHPGRVGDPVDLIAPSGHEEDHGTTFGAAELLWLLEAPGGDESRALDDAGNRARAWGGGELAVWQDGSATAVGLSLVDAGNGAPALCGTTTAWYAAAFPDAARSGAGGEVTFDGPDQDAVVRCTGDEVRVGIAEDTETATTIVGG